MTRTLVFGLGSFHGDDRLGWLVAERLAAAVSDPEVLIRRGRSPSELLDALDGVDRLIVCDACESLGNVGAIHQWHWPDIPLARLRSSGSHDLDLAGVLALGEELRLLPADVTILGVEGEVYVPGLAPSGALNAVAQRAADFIAAILRWGPGQPRRLGYFEAARLN